MVGYRSAWTKPTRDLAMKIPLEDLLLETDAPFMVPNLPPDVPNYSVPGMALCVAQAVAGKEARAFFLPPLPFIELQLNPAK